MASKPNCLKSSEEESAAGMVSVWAKIGATRNNAPRSKAAQKNGVFTRTGIYRKTGRSTTAEAAGSSRQAKDFDQRDAFRAVFAGHNSGISARREVHQDGRFGVVGWRKAGRAN